MTVDTILVAFDFSPPSEHALLFAHKLAQVAQAKLEVVHVHRELYDGRGNPELGLPWPSAGQEERYLRFLEQEVRRALSITLPAHAEDIRIHVARGEPVKHIIEQADASAAGIVCVGAGSKNTVQRIMLGSISEALLRASPVPVLVVH